MPQILNSSRIMKALAFLNYLILISDIDLTFRQECKGKISDALLIN